MNEPRWLTESQVTRIHHEQLVIFGGPAGIRDVGLLQRALDRPRNKWGYGNRELAGLAAAFGFGLAKNNPIVDGNKRAAFAAVKRSNDSHSRQIAVSLVVAGKLVREVERTID